MPHSPDQHFTRTLAQTTASALLGVVGLSLIYFYAFDPSWDPAAPWSAWMIGGCVAVGLSIILALIAGKRGDAPKANVNAYLQVGGLFLNVVAFAVVPRLTGGRPDLSNASIIISAIGLCLAVIGFWGAFTKPERALEAKTREHVRERTERKLFQKKWNEVHKAVKAVEQRREEIAHPNNQGRILELEKALKDDLKKLEDAAVRAERF